LDWTSWFKFIHCKYPLYLSFYHIITFIASLCYITFSLKVYIPNEVYTYYFHASVKGRCTKNFVLALRVGVRWVESVSEVCPEIVNYFTNHFLESVNNRPRSERHWVSWCWPAWGSCLTVPFTAIEIEEVVLSSNRDKSPGLLMDLIFLL
jgi:hypothetical protein